MSLLAAALIVTVRLYDTYPVGADRLHDATRQATPILERAGVSIAWADCRAAGTCQTPPRADELVIRIVGAGDETAGPLVLGAATIDPVLQRGTVATVYADRAEAVAAGAGVAPPAVLGRALAHEIGHLLLGTSAHARRGLMRPYWTALELKQRAAADWTFSRDEAAQLRRQVASRRRDTQAAAH